MYDITNMPTSIQSGFIIYLRVIKIKCKFEIKAKGKLATTYSLCY